MNGVSFPARRARLATSDRTHTNRLDDDKVFVRVLVATKAKNDKGVEEHTTVQVVMDPRTKKPKD